MTCYQPSPFEMVSMFDQDPQMDPSSLMSFQASDAADWTGKDNPMDLLPWDMPFCEPSFDMGNNDFLPPAYATSTSGSPEAFNGYTSSRRVTEDALSYSSLASDAESDAWSPSQSKSGWPSPTQSIGTKRPREETTTTTTTTTKPVSIKEEQEEEGQQGQENTASSRKTSLESTTSSSKSTTTTTTDVDPSVNAIAMKRKKAAHNAIEKRYRTNMNAKFVALGNAIPKTSTPAHLSSSQSGGGTTTKGGLRRSSLNQQHQHQHQPPQPQLQLQPQQNKSEILTSALAYIRELQEENRLLQNELTVLKENLLPQQVRAGRGGGGGGVMWR